MKLLIGSSLLLAASVVGAGWYQIAYQVSVKGDLTQVRSPLVLFDFDGTICPSYPLFIDQVNFFADEYGLRKISHQEIESYRDMDPKQIMGALGISHFKLPFLLKKIRSNIQDQLLEFKPVPGIVAVLQDLKSQGYSLGVLTSNSVENVLLYFQKYEIDCFDFIYAGNNIFGKEKHLLDIIGKARFNSKEDRVIYVGDEIRDVEAAKKANLISIGVTWGYNSSQLLQAHHPDYLCEEPSQLQGFIQGK
jgi:phosphoglycolate phosphatase